MKILAERALLPDGWATQVAMEIGAEGTFTRIEANTGPVESDLTMALALPGMPNLHSHAFQRAMAGLAERAAAPNDSFWSWREQMYGLVEEIATDDLEIIAAQLYLEMVERGFTAVGEFHYLHHRVGGLEHDDLAESSERIIRAARAAGIGLTHLPVVYEQAGPDAAPLSQAQKRFELDHHKLEDMLTWLERRHPPTNMLQFGAAPHSLRAVPVEVVAEIADSLGRRPLHIHAAEQTAEVEALLSHTGKRPVELLMERAPVDERWCIVHATHITPHEVELLAESRAVVGLCPETEANLGDGIFPARAFGMAGGKFGIGSDSHIRVDPPGELRMLEYGQRLQEQARARLAPEGASVGRTLYEAASEGGAQALAQPMGALDIGMRGDVVSLDTDHPALLGRSGDEIIDSWIFSAATPAVKDVVIAGRHLVSDGRHKSRDAILEPFRECMTRLADKRHTRR